MNVITKMTDRRQIREAVRIIILCFLWYVQFHMLSNMLTFFLVYLGTSYLQVIM